MVNKRDTLKIINLYELLEHAFAIYVSEQNFQYKYYIYVASFPHELHLCVPEHVHKIKFLLCHEFKKNKKQWTSCHF